MPKLKVGNTVTFQFTGELVTRRESEDEKGSDSEATVEVDSVELIKTGGKEPNDTESYDDVMDEPEEDDEEEEDGE